MGSDLFIPYGIRTIGILIGQHSHSATARKRTKSVEKRTERTAIKSVLVSLDKPGCHWHICEIVSEMHHVHSE